MADADPKTARSPTAAPKAGRQAKGGNVYNLKGEKLDSVDDIWMDRDGARPVNLGSFLDRGGDSISYRKRP